MPGPAAYQKQLIEKLVALKKDLAFLKPNSQDIWAEGQQVSVLNQGSHSTSTCTCVHAHTQICHTQIFEMRRSCARPFGEHVDLFRKARDVWQKTRVTTSQKYFGARE